jgi:hypothetical protein
VVRCRCDARAIPTLTNADFLTAIPNESGALFTAMTRGAAVIYPATRLQLAIAAATE